jgi:hypothetical protein
MSRWKESERADWWTALAAMSQKVANSRENAEPTMLVRLSGGSWMRGLCKDLAQGF